MLNLSTEQSYFSGHPPADAVIAEHPFTGPSDAALDWAIAPSQITPEISYTSWISHENALGLSGMNGPESVWAVDPPTRPPQFFSNSFLHHPDSVVHFWQPPAPYHPFDCGEVALVGVGESLIPPSVHPIMLSESRPVQKLTGRSPIKRAGESRSLAHSTTPPIRSLRHTPYPIGPDSTRRSASPVSAYQCRWSDGAGPCCVVVTGTKNAIGLHLQANHAIRLKADKTIQVCHWEGCHKPMQRESIARHVLAVHMKDKVLCPSCGSRFARTDSLQRHQRKQCPAEGEASDACKAAGE